MTSWTNRRVSIHVGEALHNGTSSEHGISNCKTTTFNIRRIFIFGYFHVRPKIWCGVNFCFTRFSVTVYTGGSSAGRKFDAAEMDFSPGRPKFEWAEHL